MVKKLTVKTWTGTGLILAVCLGMAIAALSWYGPSALALLQGRMPLVDEPQSNIYGMSGIGLFMLVISIVILIKQLAAPVSKRVRSFLEEHPEVTMEQLDQEFVNAKKIQNMWIGEHRTFSHDMSCVVVENTEIVRAYVEKERVKRSTNYYICLNLKNGKTERVKTEYHNLSEILNSYIRYPNVRVESFT